MHATFGLSQEFTFVPGNVRTREETGGTITFNTVMLEKEHT